MKNEKQQKTRHGWDYPLPKPDTKCAGSFISGTGTDSGTFFSQQLCKCGGINDYVRLDLASVSG